MTETVEGGPATGTVELVELPPKRAAVVRFSGRTDELPVLMGHAFAATSEAIAAAGARFAGHPFARYFSFGEPIEAVAGFPFEGGEPEAEGVEIVTLPSGLAAMIRHVGPYETIGEAWDRGTAWIRNHGYATSGPGWECYLTGPEDPGPPITEVFWPLA
jgi:effector-binding domain-containing protein